MGVEGNNVWWWYIPSLLTTDIIANNCVERWLLDDVGSMYSIGQTWYRCRLKCRVGEGPLIHPTT